MHHFIDRRQNPKGKSLGNRQRFLKRVRRHLKQAVNEAMRGRSVKDMERGETVSVPKKQISEPRFVLSPSTGSRQRIYPGNREFLVGDTFDRPGGGGGGGRTGSEDGSGEDDFSFALTREEFLDILFEDLELPDLVKTDLTHMKTFRLRRAGLTTSGTHSNLNVRRTMKNAFGRRLALGRPDSARMAELRAEIEALDAAEPDAGTEEELAELRAELSRLEARRRAVAFVDPVDIRYTHFKPEEEPNTKAVMFCLMDVSASMREREKELAKRFFILLHLFLERCYETSEIVFIRHTHYAQEVDEETFFHGRETGGTRVSTALQEMRRIVAKRYPTNEWNIYVAQASDGENLSGDSADCVALLNDEIMRLCQYFAYIEIADEMPGGQFVLNEADGELWSAYRAVDDGWANFQMRRVATPGDIYPVFRELFARRERG